MIEDFEKMFKNEDLVDVSLSCEDGTIRAHKVILSACSSYFRQILSKFTSPYQYPVLIIKDMCFADLKAIIEFIYRGEVTVPQEQLTSVLKSAEALKVKGLADVNNQKCGIGHKFSSVADANDPTGVGSSNSSARKRKRRRRKDQENREKSSTGGALNSNSSGRSGADRSGQVSDEELNKQLLASTDASEYSEEEDELSTSHNLHPSQHTSHHQHLQLAPAHHQTNSAISVISSEGDIEPSRLLEQTMITGDVRLQLAFHDDREIYHPCNL